MEGPPERSPQKFRPLLFRVIAIAMGLSPFLAAELVCRAFHLGHPADSGDPFVGFDETRPLFVVDRARRERHTSDARLGYFCEQRFPVAKPADEFRVFCLGGSTVYGRPFAAPTAFPAWLEFSLQAADPQRSWRVVNCGGVSYASYRLAPIMEEVLQYEPDLIIVCTGHNEFLEDRTYDRLKSTPQLLCSAEQVAEHSYAYNLTRNTIYSSPAPGSRPPLNTLPTEVDARLDYRDGLAEYTRDPAWRQDVIAHFRWNVRRMISMTQVAEIPMILVAPASNLRDCPPFKSLHRSTISEADRLRWKELWTVAEESYARDMPAALAALQEALRIDEQHAGLHYQLGQCYDALGDAEHARQHFSLAKEHDICPLRMLDPMYDALREIASQTNTPLVDANRIISEQCRDGIADSSWMLDHVHPSIRGHQLIANAIADAMVRQAMVTPSEGWTLRRDQAYARQFNSLDNLYFLRGQQRLKVVNDWARGRATLLHSGTSASSS